ncbi:MAG: antibiotic biosynthesis monooxygenase [Pseudomonadota bacterium]
MSTTTILIHLKAAVPADNRAAFKDLMSELVERTEREQGTLVYEWFEVGEDGTWHIFERYADAESGDRHVQGFAKNFAGRFFDLVDSCTAVVSTNATPYIKGVLTSLAPVYITQHAGFNRF